jgi:hypothetical protein
MQMYNYFLNYKFFSTKWQQFFFDVPDLKKRLFSLYFSFVLTQKKSTKRKSQDFAYFATTTNKIAKQNKVGKGSVEVLSFCTADWHFVFNAISLLSV